MTADSDSSTLFCTRLLDLEQEVRDLRSLKELEYLMVNRSQQFLPAQSVVFWQKNTSGAIKVARLSNVVDVDEQNAPFVQEMESWLKSRVDSLPTECEILSSDQLHPLELQTYFDWPAQSVLWCPLKSHLADNRQAGLLFLQPQSWQQKDQLLAKRLASVYGYAYRTLQLVHKPARRYQRLLSKPLWLGVLIGATLLIPVQQSVIGSATVIASQPDIVTAPLTGVIETIEVEPNQSVKPGVVLLEYEKSALQNEYEVSERLLQAAQAKLYKTQQQAFNNKELKSQLALLKNQIEQRRLELAFARDQLQRATLKADHSGIVILDDRQALIGKPVQVGEKIMVIADSQKVELEIQLAVEDAIIMEPGAKVSLFLNSSPTQAVEAELSYAGYHAELTAEGYLAYRLLADIKVDSDMALPRIGQRGSAKIHGDHVSLFYYLFRRPLSVLRQTFGF